MRCRDLRDLVRDTHFMRAQIAIAMSTDKTVMEAIVGEPSLDSPSIALPSSWEGSTDGVERGLLDMTG